MTRAQIIEMAREIYMECGEEKTIDFLVDVAAERYFDPGKSCFNWAHRFFEDERELITGELFGREIENAVATNDGTTTNHTKDGQHGSHLEEHGG